MKKHFSFDLRALGVFRIAVALMVLFDLIDRARNFTVHYTDAGIMPLDLVTMGPLNPWKYSPYFLSSHVLYIYLIFGYQIFMALCLLVGYKTKFVQFMTWFLLCSLQARNPPVNYGADALLGLVLFLSLFLPLDERFSLKKHKKEDPVHDSYFNLVYISQIACLYFFAAFCKTGDSWQDGSALFMALSVEFYNNSFGKLFLDYPLLLKGLTYLGWGIEFIAPILLFHMKSRHLGIGLIIALQLGIASMMSVGIFPYVSLIALIPLMGRMKNDRERREEPKVQRLVAATLFFIILFSNITNTFEIKKTVLNRLTTLFKLHQHWSMFSPNPPDGDSWFVLSLETEDSKRIDLLNQGRPVSNQKPDDFKVWLIDDRWNAYYFKLAYSQNQKFLNRLADYHIEKWNQKHGTNYHKAELYMLYQATFPAGSQPELKHLLFKE